MVRSYLLRTNDGGHAGDIEPLDQAPDGGQRCDEVDLGEFGDFSHCASSFTSKEYFSVDREFFSIMNMYNPDIRTKFWRSPVLHDALCR